MPDRTLIAVAALSLTYLASAQAESVSSNRNAEGNTERHGILQLIKTCPHYNLNAGDYCAVIQSNLEPALFICRAGIRWRMCNRGKSPGKTAQVSCQRLPMRSGR